MRISSAHCLCLLTGGNHQIATVRKNRYSKVVYRVTTLLAALA